jgi:hypothetical protein
MVVGTALTAALALVALPGLAGSKPPRPMDPVPVSAFQSLSVPANDARSVRPIVGLDAAFVSSEVLTADSTLIEPGVAPALGPVGRASLDQPDPSTGKVRKPARTTLRGQATFYDNGTTAMRLPRGTTVIICGKAGCIERIVNDYGPIKPSRIVDLYRPDFFKICGCASWSGITNVTVYVY